MRAIFGRIVDTGTRPLFLLVLLAVSAATAFVRSELAAQEIISSEVSCPNCTLSVTRVADLGRNSESLITPVSTVCRGRNGHFYVSNLIVRSQIAVYDADGAHLRTFGSSGSGPGEFRGISATICGIDGKLRVFDSGNGRVTVLTEEGSLVASHNFQGGYFEGGVALRDGGIAVNTTIGTAESVGHPIHLVSPDGEFERSIGRSGTGPYMRNPITDKRILAKAGEQQLWAAHMNRYQIDLWSTDGRLLKTIERSAEWFQPWEGLDPGEPFFARPKPRILSMFQDSEGNLWTSSLVPSTDWKPSSRESVKFGMSGPTVAMLEPKWDSIIEVIDVESGRLCYAARLKGLAFQFIGNGIAHRPREAPDGTHYSEVVRMRLINP